MGNDKALKAKNIQPVLEGNWLQQQFIFQNYCVPAFAAAAIRIIGEEKQVPLWLCEHSCVVLGMERTLFELEASLGLIKSKESLSRVNIPIYPSIRSLAFGEFVGAFDAVKWKSRFEIHQQACRRSLEIFARSNSADCCDPDVSMARASFHGLIENKSALPDFLREILLNQAKSEAGRKKFYRNAAEPKQGESPTMPWLEHWLVEVSPIIKSNRWGYEDVLSLARKKFPKFTTLKSKEQIRERWRKLKLPGMPRGTVELTIKQPYTPDMRIALFIDGLHSRGIGYWLKGQRGMTSKNFEWG